MQVLMSYNTHLNYWARAISMVFALLFASHSYAAIELSDTEELRSRAKQIELEREQQMQLPRVDLQEGATKESAQLLLPEETPCFTINQFLLEVPTQLSAKARILGASTQQDDPFRFLQDYLETFNGRCVGRQGVGVLLNKLTDQLLSKGYTTTRLGIPEQDLSGGVLKLTLIPGIIHQIKFTDPAITGSFNAFPSGDGDLFNLRNFEQGLEQMKRVTSQDVEMKLAPAGGLGESDVLVSVKRSKPWKLVTSLDDSGAKGTGKLQAGVTLGFDNLLNASDIFTFGATSDAERDSATKGTQGYNTSYTIPFGYWTLTLAASDYHYHQRIVGANQTFVSSGKSQSNEGKLAYLFYRDQKQKYSVQFRTGQRWSHSYIDDTEVEVQYRNTVFAELALIHKNYIGQAQLDVSVAYRWGAPWYGAQHDAANLTADSPLLNYQLEVFDASLSTPFKILDKPFTYMGTLRAQNSHSPLYATEWFSIGNRWSVRGFDGENTLGAEKGYFLRNEIGMPLSNTQQSIYAGIDYGRVYGPNVINLSGDQLAGAVLGMRGSLVKNMAYDVFASSPLYKPVGFRTEDPALGFSLNYQF